jgi:hypothetical protein
MPRRFRVEKNPRGIDGARADDDDLPQHLLLGAGLAIEILHTPGESLVVDQDPGDDRVRPDLEMTGLQRER